MTAPTYSAADLKHRTAHYAELAAQAEVMRKAAAFDELVQALYAINHRAERSSFGLGNDVTSIARTAIRKAQP